MSTLDAERHFAVQKLYLEHHGWLRTWLMRRLGGCHDRAEDFAQDAFVQVMGAKETLQLEEPRAFLTVVAKRLLFNHYRRQDIERSYLEALAALPEPEVPSEETRAIALEALHELAQVLENQPIVVRRAFIYAQLEGLPYAAITQRLGISLATFKRYLTRVAQRCYFSELFS